MAELSLNRSPDLSLPPKPKGRVTRRVAYGFLGVSTLAIVYILFFRPSELDRIITHLDRTEPGWRMADLWAEHQRTIPPDEKNSFLVVEQAKRKITQEVLNELNNPEGLRQLVNEADLRTPPVLNPDVLNRAAIALIQAEEPLALARTLRKFKTGTPKTTLAPDGLGTLLPHMESVRDLQSLLVLEGIHAAWQRDPRRALESAKDCVHIARSLGGEPLHVSAMVRSSGTLNALQIIELTLRLNPTPPDELLAELQQLLAEENPMAHLTRSLEFDRASLHQLYENFRTGKDSVRAFAGRYALSKPAGGATMQSVAFLFQERGEHLAIMKYCNELVEVSRRPEHEWPISGKTIPTPVGSGSVVFRLLNGLGYGETLFKSYLSSAARLRTGYVALACERHRLKTGSWPKSLDEIAPELLPKVPLDPYTGQPLKYKLAENVAIVYSVGENGIDDGGKLWKSHKPPPGGEYDVGFQLFDPHHRTGKQ